MRATRHQQPVTSIQNPGNIFSFCLSNRQRKKGMVIRADEILIKAAQQGDFQAFHDLVKKYESRVASTVFGMLGRCLEAEDVGQETFIRFYKALRHFRGDSSVATYLTRIAINLSLNELKRRKRRSLFFLPEPYEAQISSGDENDPVHYDIKEAIQHALQRLDPKFRTVLVLRLIDGYSTEETAQLLDIPVGTVLSRLARAQMKMRNLLSDDEIKSHEQEIKKVKAVVQRA
jgi:RNA polymerase sigma-70 factor (ECF subfamily)